MAGGSHAGLSCVYEYNVRAAPREVEGDGASDDSGSDDGYSHGWVS